MKKTLALAALMALAAAGVAGSAPEKSDVEALLRKSGPTCSGGFDVGQGLLIFTAKKLGKHIVSIVESPMNEGIRLGVVSVPTDGGSNCALWYAPRGEAAQALDSFVKWSTSLDSQGYLTETNLDILGWWTGGDKKYLAIRERVAGPRSRSHTLLLTREGQVAASIPVGLEFSEPRTPDMDPDDAYLCDIDVSERNVVRLINCRQPGVKGGAPSRMKTYRWRNGALVEDRAGRK